MNPCPCGYFGDAVKPCTCAPSTVTKYQKKISGPLLDRIDIHVEMPRVEYDKLSGDRAGESSEVIRMRVQAARQRQRERFVNIKSAHRVVSNADMRVGGAAVLQIGRSTPKPDAFSNGTGAVIGARVSSHPEVGAHDRGSGGE